MDGTWEVNKKFQRLAARLWRRGRGKVFWEKHEEDFGMEKLKDHRSDAGEIVCDCIVK